MAYEALAAYRHERLSCRFVSNVDSHDLLTALSDLDPAHDFVCCCLQDVHHL